MPSACCGLYCGECCFESVDTMVRFLKFNILFTIFYFKILNNINQFID